MMPAFKKKKKNTIDQVIIQKAQDKHLYKDAINADYIFVCTSKCLYITQLQELYL